MIKLISKMMNMELPKVEAQPGMASVLKVLMKKMAAIEMAEISISIKEKMATLVMMISKKTAMVPNPCNSKEVKFIFDSPAYRLPLSTGMDV